MKCKTIIKRAIASLLAIVMVLCSMPVLAMAADADVDLSEQKDLSKVTINVTKQYGHELHYTTVGGVSYPLFCIEYGRTSPSTSKAVGRKEMASDAAIEAAKWITAGYYMVHGNTLDYKDMAMCQKKVWEVMGNNVSWTFSNEDYNEWCSVAESNMKKITQKPSFNNTNVGTIVSGNSLTVTDTNGVLKDYPAFTKSGNGWKIIHSENSNSLTVTTDKSCTSTSFNIKNTEYLKKHTGNDEDLVMFYPYGSESYQKLIYSAYYDPVTLSLEGNIQPVGNLQLKKTSEDGAVSDIKFTVTNANGYNKTVTTDSKGEWKLEGLTPGQYTVTEQSIDKYVPQKSQTVTVSGGNQTTTVTFSNILKKFRVNVTKQDIEKTHSQGDAKLSGAVYGLYKGNDLVAQYTTDADGAFTTDYYVCDTDWTIKEITPSEGYLLDDTVYSVGADPKDYSVEYNTTSNTVKEQVKKGKVSIIKHTDNGETQIETPEKGAEFQIYLKSSGSFANADKDERDTMICDEDGFTSSKLLPYGVYTIHQTKSWDGKVKIADFDVFIQSDGTTYKFLINNANFSSYLKVVKLDAETNKQIPYEGAAFEIYDVDGHRVSMQYTYPQVTSIHTFYTNSEGYLITPEKLPYGDYTLVEVQAPYGYVLDSTPISFSITQDNASTDTGVTVVKVKAKDVAQKGIIEIAKTGEVFSSVTSTTDETTKTNTYQPVYEVGNLKGAVYEIYAAEDIVTTDGTVRAEKGDLVDTVTTGDDGIAKTKQLYLGKYTVKEKTAPNTFVKSDEIYDVELTYAGQDVKVTSTSLSAYDDRQTATLAMCKVLEEDQTYGIGNNGEINSVQFGIYADEEVTAADGTNIPKDGLVTIANCDADGKITFVCDLPIGFKWYAKEITTDVHYNLSDKHYKFDTEYAGQNTKVISIDINSGKNIGNTLKRGKIVGVKMNQAGNTLEGATIGIFKVGTTEYSSNNAIVTTTTNEKGAFTFDNVPYGKWIVKEISAPTGYTIDATQHNVDIASDGVVSNIEMTDKQVLISKTDITGEKEIVGAELTITDENGNVVDSWTSTETAHYASGLVEGQKYTLTEKTAPLGYVVATSIEFVVSTDKTTQQVTMVDKQVLISKTDVTTGTELEGAKLTITDKNGNIIEFVKLGV